MTFYEPDVLTPTPHRLAGSFSAQHPHPYCAACPTRPGCLSTIPPLDTALTTRPRWSTAMAPTCRGNNIPWGRWWCVICTACTDHGYASFLTSDIDDFIFRNPIMELNQYKDSSQYGMILGHVADSMEIMLKILGKHIYGWREVRKCKTLPEGGQTFSLKVYISVYLGTGGKFQFCPN